MKMGGTSPPKKTAHGRGWSRAAFDGRQAAVERGAPESPEVIPGEENNEL